MLIVRRDFSARLRKAHDLSASDFFEKVGVRALTVDELVADG